MIDVKNASINGRNCRIGFYPGDEDYAVWDYTIGREFADMLVIVNTNSTGEINYVTWES